MPILYLVLASFMLTACQMNPYDHSQQPEILISTDTPPQISWKPQGAQVIRVYFADAEVSTENQWMLTAEGNNSIQSPITYGVVPAGARQSRAAKPLEPGEKYMVLIRRKDTEHVDQGLSNNINRYESREYFEAPIPIVRKPQAVTY